MFLDKIIGPPESYSLQARSLNAVLFVTLLTGMILFGVNSFRAIGSDSKAEILALTGLAALVYWLSRRKPNQRHVILLFYLMEMVVIVYVWRFFGGFSGHTVIFLLAYASMAPIITRGVVRHIVLWSHIFLALSLVFIEVHYPGIPAYFVSREEEIFDTFFIYVGVSLGLVLIAALLQINHTRQQQKLEELNRSKDLFFSIIAHDLKAPLGSLTELGEIIHLQNKQLDERTREEIQEVIYHASKHTYDLLDNLLQWSRVETGSLQPQPSSFPVADLVESCRGLFRQMIRGKELQLELDLEKGLRAWADMHMIHTVVRNLLSNAIKFTPDGKTITIRSRRIGSEVLLEVTDQGTGIDPAALESLFRLESKHIRHGTRGEKGTGLGLKLSHSFVARNGGQLRVRSTPDQGSTFELRLPAPTDGSV
ncbi:MAG: HAMP domain-containing sensor histidine kinase [Bacteroidales bacterium]